MARPKKLPNMIVRTVRAEEKDFIWIKSQGLSISSFFRQAIKEAKK